MKSSSSSKEHSSSQQPVSSLVWVRLKAILQVNQIRQKEKENIKLNKNKQTSSQCKMSNLPLTTLSPKPCVCVFIRFFYFTVLKCFFLLYALAPLDRAQVRRDEEVQRWLLRPKLMQLERWKVNEWSRRRSSSLTERVGELGGVIALCSQTLPPSPLCCWPTPAVPLSSWRGRCGSSQKYCPVPC